MNSVYKKEYKVSVPTLEYIKTSTGIDVVLEEGNKERAEGKINALTTKARDLLFMGKSLESQRIISYLIFKDIWKDAWENYVIRYIEATFFYGDESAWEKLPDTIERAYKGSVLNVTYFTPNIRYEVKQSTEDF